MNPILPDAQSRDHRQHKPLLDRSYRDVPEEVRSLEWASREVSHGWPVELRGSWASGEYHLVEHAGAWDSLSDFDLVTQDLLSEEARTAISEFLRAHASFLKSQPAISFRTADELGGVYSRERFNTPADLDRSEVERLVMFWLSIGIAESCSSIEKHRMFRGCDVRAYFMNKLYLNAWRMIFHVEGTYLRSYADVLEAIPGVSPGSKRTSLLLKRGVASVPNASGTLSELGSTLMEAMMALSPSRNYAKALQSLREGVLPSQASSSDAIEILSVARNYATTTVDESIIDHSAAKLSRHAVPKDLTRTVNRRSSRGEARRSTV